MRRAKAKPPGERPSHFQLTLLNEGRAVRCSVERVPADHKEQRAHLRLRNLPVNESANTVLVVKLEFDGPPAVPGSTHPTTSAPSLHIR